MCAIQTISLVRGDFAVAGGEEPEWVSSWKETSALCLLECRSFRRLDNVQGFWTSTAERLKKGGGRQVETQRRAQRRQNKGSGPSGAGPRGAGLVHPRPRAGGLCVSVAQSETSLNCPLRQTNFL